MTLQSLPSENIQCCLAENVDQAKQYLKKEKFHFCLTDMRLPDGNGLDLIEHVQQYYPQLPIAVITAYGDVASAVESLKKGAFDFVSKPFKLATLRNLARTALQLSPQVEGNGRSPLIGQSDTMENTRRMISKVARSQAPVLLTGESGTGKELAARSIHQQSARQTYPFVPVNCSAIPESLLESELFGHCKGSFTGAHKDHEGLFQQADQGTLLLDEIAEIAPHIQVKLLRVLQEKTIRPVGGGEISVNVRILSATHQSLLENVQNGHFREDLYYRLNVIELRMPSLRERSQDIPALVEAFLQRSGSGLTLSQTALNALMDYSFPGNVRELENIIERAVALCETSVIEADDLLLPANVITDPHKAPQFREGMELDHYLAQLEKQAIVDMLQATGGNKTEAARKLGISFRALRYRLKRLQME